MDLEAALLDSWVRQCRIVAAVSARVTEENRHLRPSEEGWPLDHQLAHIHKVRQYWLANVAPERAKELGETFVDGWETPIADLDLIKNHLEAGGPVVGAAVKDLLQAPLSPVGFYDNPVLFLQHMIWHEGWHVGMILLALRRAGQEPPEEWEEANIWGEWRTEVW